MYVLKVCYTSIVNKRLKNCDENITIIIVVEIDSLKIDFYNKTYI